MKTIWKNPKITNPEIVKYYWVYTSTGTVRKGRVILGCWVDSNYSRINDVVLFAEITPPRMPTETELNETSTL
jgi:hypothetical protein